MRVRAFMMGVAALALAAPLAGQQPVEVSRPTSGGGSLDVQVTSGELRLVGWNRNEVRVTGQLARESDRLEVSSRGDRVTVRVHASRGGRGDTELEIRYPARKALQITSMSADVDVRGAAGAATVHTTSGNVRVEGNPASLAVNSRSGDIILDGGTGRLTVNTTSGGVVVSGPVREQAQINTVSGDIELRGTVGSLHAKSVSGSIQAQRVGTAAEIHTVSGDIRIAARTLVGSYNSVSGDISLSGSPGRVLGVRSHSGDVEVRFPRRTDAELAITTWSGEIGIEMDGAQLMQSASRRDRQVRLGRGGTRVELATFSGTVRVLEQ